MLTLSEDIERRYREYHPMRGVYKNCVGVIDLEEIRNQLTDKEFKRYQENKHICGSSYFVTKSKRKPSKPINPNNETEKT